MRYKVIIRLDWFIGNILSVILAPISRALGFILKLDHSISPPKSIVILKLLGGGNFALAAPFFIGLRRSFPDARISIVTFPALAPFAKTIGVFDQIIIVRPSSLVSLFYSTFNAWRRIIFSDYLIDLEVHSKLSTCFGLLTMSRNRIGFFTHDFFIRQYLHTHTIFYSMHAPRHLMYESILKLIGGASVPLKECGEHILNSLGIKENKRTNWLAVGAGCSELALERRLTAEQWKLVFQARIKSLNPQRVVFLGSAGEKKEIDVIVKVLSDSLPEYEFENRCGLGELSQSLSLLSQCSFYWGIDSALLHYARLFGVPTLSFWGPTNPKTLLLHNEGTMDEIVYRPILCSPCVHASDEPPCRGNNLCIQQYFRDSPLSNEEVLSNITSRD